MTAVSYFEIGGEIIECTAHQITGRMHAKVSKVETSAVETQVKTPVSPEPVAMAYTPYSYGNPLVWAATQVFLRIAQRKQSPGVDPLTGEPNVY
jgi:hypothetical protein